MYTAVISINFPKGEHKVRIFSGEDCWKKAEKHLQELQKKNEKDWQHIVWRDQEANVAWGKHVLGNAEKEVKVRVEEKTK